MSEDDEMTPLIEQAAAGNADMLGELFQRCRDRLLRMATLRMDRRLRGRVDPADIVQETFVVATSRFSDYVREPQRVPFYLWLRFLAVQKLMEIHRAHFSVKSRDVTREVSPRIGPSADSTSELIVAQFLANQTSPSQAAARSEAREKLEEAIQTMDPADREVITLRNFEQLTNAEVANLLEIAESAASNRYIRALKRLRTILESCME